VNTEGTIKNDNPEKLEKEGTQDENKQHKNTTQYVLDTTILQQVVLNERNISKI
jgi:hypothetical protein